MTQSFMKLILIVILMLVFAFLFALFIYPTQWIYANDGMRRTNRFNGCVQDLDVTRNWMYNGIDKICMSGIQLEQKKEEENAVLLLSQSEPQRKREYNLSKTSYVKEISAQASIKEENHIEKFFVELYNPKNCVITSVDVYIKYGGKEMTYSAFGETGHKSKGEYVYDVYNIESLNENNFVWGVLSINYRGDAGIDYDTSCLKQ